MYAEPVIEGCDMLGVGVTTLPHKLGSLAHTGDLVGWQGAGTEPGLVASPVHLGDKFAAKRPTNAKRANALWRTPRNSFAQRSSNCMRIWFETSRISHTGQLCLGNA